jgi:hypothetical protein
MRHEGTAKPDPWTAISGTIADAFESATFRPEAREIFLDLVNDYLHTRRREVETLTLGELRILTLSASSAYAAVVQFRLARQGRAPVIQSV